MKPLICLKYFLLIFSVSSFLNAQEVPNGSFEIWVIGGGPDLWYTNNQYWPPLECIQVFPADPAYSGNICAMGIVDSCVELQVIYPPILTSFDINLTSKPEALHGFYKYFPIEEDQFNVSVMLYTDSVHVGQGSHKTNQEVDKYTEFIVNFEYTTSDVPNKAIIVFTIDSSLVDDQLHQGSIFYIDSLTFGPLSTVRQDQNVLPFDFSLQQNYPNPFNPTTKIRYGLPQESKVKITIYNTLGEKVKELVNIIQEAGYHEINFEVSSLSSGVYIYTMQAKALDGSRIFMDSKKLVLLK